MTGDAGRSCRSRLCAWLNLRSISCICFLGVFLVLCGLEWFAERWLPLAILLFAPAQLLAIPAVLLGLIAVWKRRWLWLAGNVICLLAILIGFMGWRIRSSDDGRKNDTFSVITHNIGQGNRAAFVDSFPDEEPDVVLLQDVFHANRRERDYMRRYPAYETRGLGQYMLLTPHKIESALLVREALWLGQPVAARFVLNVKGRSVAVYCVHMPTPRDSLAAAISPSVMLEMLGLREARTGKFASYREWIDARVAVARELAAVFDKETLPFVVGGDFNTPDHGVIYHIMASRMKDAHAEAGRGWGFTFPGGRETRLSRFIGQWLRLDYLFAGRGWKPVDCRVAADDRSQHRAVLARFVPVP